MSQSYATQDATKICTKDTVKATGLNIWASGEHSGNGPEVDVIAVQGLAGDKYYTWVRKPVSARARPTRRCCFSFQGHRRNAQADALPNGVRATSDRTDTAEVMWLRDFLPGLIPTARIATYSYESDWLKGNVKTNLRQCGDQLLNVLLQNRSTEKEGRRPLVFIGHSLGGLIIKQALVLADHGDTYRDIRLSTAGIIFLGTPHEGSDAAIYGVRLAQAVGHDTALLESLTKNSTALYGIARDFEASYSDTDIVCFYETKDKAYGPLKTQFVDHKSASLLGKREIYLSTDHSGLSKFYSSEDENFLLVRPEIQRMVQKAPQRSEERYRSHTVGTEKAQGPRDRQEDQETLLRQTFASDYKSDKDLVSERVPGTCEWFFEDNRFLEWRDSNTSRLLWVSAGPGCGKSVLARALIDERSLCTNTTAPTVCYFFFKDGQKQRTRGANALCALLHQLFESTSLITHALPSYKSYKKKLQDAFGELWEILVKSAQDPAAGEIICVLDALDECEKNARKQLVEKLAHFFSQAVSFQNTSIKLKFLVTSRPYDDLEQSFRPLSGVSAYMRFDGDEKSQRIGQDINLVIDAKIPHITGDFSDEDRLRISNRLKEMDNRTYLWLFLTIDIIENSPSNFRRKSDIDSLLSNLPSEISDAYETILSRSSDDPKARILLELIIAATRPLSLEEANMALAMATRGESCKSQSALELWPQQSFAATVKNMCGLFVSVHDGKLFLIHQTAREFLTRTSKPARTNSHKWEGRLDMAAAHSTMSRICLDYLDFQDVASIHESHLGQGGHAESRNECFLLNYAAINWPIHYTSQPAELVKDALIAASGRGHNQKVQVLLDSGTADIDGKALCAASGRGHNQVVQMLLASGATDAAGEALSAASDSGYDQIVQMLLDKGAIYYAQVEAYDEALGVASSQGHDQVVQILQKAKESVR